MYYLLQVCVGRAERNSKDGKTKVDKKFGVVKINIHKEAPYTHLLEKCRRAVWAMQGDSDVYSYQLLDSKGLNIEDKLIIDQPDGTDFELPWSLESYVQVNKRAYTTQPKFNVLRILNYSGKCIEL